jgi:hypothetical protein
MARIRTRIKALVDGGEHLMEEKMPESVPSKHSTYSDTSSHPDSIGRFCIKYVIHPISVVVPSAFLLLLTTYFVWQEFKADTQYGIRSLAAAIIPLILIGFLTAYHRELLATLGKIPPFISFLLSIGWGIGILVVVESSGYFGKTSIPLTELVLSGSFTLLIYNYVENDREARVLSYYYGIFLGFLFYIVFVDLPSKMIPEFIK